MKRRYVAYFFVWLTSAIGNANISLAKEELIATKSDDQSIVDADPTRKIIDLDKAIGRECIKFARFNIHFHLDTNRHWPWRDWLYPLGQETGTALSFSNTITDLNERAKGLSNLTKVSKSARANGLSCAIAGSAISGSSSAAELIQNGIVEWRATKKGFSPHDSVIFVQNIVHTIDTLLAKRSLIVSSMAPSVNRDVIELEGVLLTQIRHQLLFEFKRWSVNSREMTWNENVFFALNTAQNFLTCGCGIYSYEALNHRALTGTAAIGYVVADSISTLDPPFRTLMGICVRKYQRHYLAKIFPEEAPLPTEKLLKKWDEVDKLAAIKKSSFISQELLSEEGLLSEKSRHLDVHITTENTTIEKLRRVAAQQAISGPLIGMASLARSILYTVAYYGYSHNPQTVNNLAFAGRISQATGQGYSLLNTPTVAVMHALYKRKLSKRGELPEQILQQRLKRLDALELQIQSF